MKSLTKLKRHTPQGDGGYAVSLAFAAFAEDVTPRKGTQTTASLCCTFSCGEAGQLLFCEISGGSRYFSGLFPTEGNSAGFL
jgi:hypothetical protein